MMSGMCANISLPITAIPGAVTARAQAARRFARLPALRHSVDLVNGRRFFAAPQAMPSRRYFGRFNRLLEGSADQTIDFVFGIRSSPAGLVPAVRRVSSSVCLAIRRAILARLAVVSKRVSVPAGDGAKRAGGLEVALRPALQHNGGVWLGWSGKVGTREKLRTRSIKHKNVEYVVTDLTKHDYQEYYNGFANRVLWPILHYRLDLAEFARRDLSGYFRVNDHFATELEKVITDDDLVWVHDYHMIPIAAALRRQGHPNRIGFFLHVPFPPPEIITSLPNHEQLIPLLMQYDVVGFQTAGDADNFVRYLMSECNQDRDMRIFEIAGRHTTVSVHGQQTRIGDFPVGIEPRAFQRLARHKARSPMVQEMVASLDGRVLIIGVDRLDYSKGLVQRFDAFDHFLASHQEWTDKVVPPDRT